MWRVKTPYTAVMLMFQLTASLAGLGLAFPSAIKLLMVAMGGEVASSLVNPKVRFTTNLKVVSLSLGLVIWIWLGLHFAQSEWHITGGVDQFISAVCVFYGIGAVVKTLTNLHEAGVSVPPVLIQWLYRAQGLTPAEKRELQSLAAKDQENPNAKATSGSAD